MTGNEYKINAQKHIDALKSAGNSPKTQDVYRVAAKRFGAYIDAHDLGETEITPEIIIGFRNELAETVKTNTVSSYIMRLHTFFGWARDTLGAGKNPVLTMAIPQRKEVEYNLLTKAEIEKIINSPAPAYVHDREKMKAIVLLFIMAGLRREELIALTRADLDFDGKVIRVRHGKGDKSREVPFPAKAREAVKAYLESDSRPDWLTDEDLLFGSQCDENGHKVWDQRIWKPMNGVALNTAVKRYVMTLTGRDVHLHTLRHAAASLWDDMGIDLRTIQLALGHSSLHTTERVYVNLLQKSRAANAINAAFGEAENDG